MKSVLIQFVWETFRWILTLKKKSDWAKYCWYLFRAVGESFTFSNGIFFCCHFLQEISMIEFYAWLYCMPIHLVTNIEKRFMRNATGCAEKSFGWYPGKSADGYKSWQNTEEFPAHFIHFIKPDTFVKSEKHIKPIHRDQKLDPEISHSTWEETNLFKYCIPTVCRYITWN